MRQPCGGSAGAAQMSRRTTRWVKREEKLLHMRKRRPLLLRRLLAFFAVAAACVLISRHGGVSYLLLWCTLLPPLYALVWRLTAGRGFRAMMRVDAPSAQRGERLGCSLFLINESPLPIPLIRFRMSGGRLRFDEIGEQRVSLAPGEIRELRFTPMCVHCGKTEVGAVELRLNDPFALAERRLSEFASAHVEPRVQRLERLAIAPPEELEQHGTRTYFGERTPNGELRAYQSGDDVRRVHWKASALEGRPMLRVTEPESKNEEVLLPDLRGGLPEGNDGLLVEDSIREGSLALADWFVRHGRPLRVLPDESRALAVRTVEDLQRLRVLMSGDCFTGSRRPDEMMERDLASGSAVRRYIIMTWEFDELLLRRAARCIELGAEVTLLCIGGGEERREQAANAVSRLEFRQVNARHDVFDVLSG